ncbi:hypothetical protein CPB84DRAFT_1849797 [Gymnopilus junonius]|uniref:Uncharacterized protein n=1 Tax=Gymnopilus junonius TaxID=109634 RepID=A0A9P5NHZ8_GYMJU|nr:hypothetical protein CPB84DRAFT_1849797 [Gymnopilus junonius]
MSIAISSAAVASQKKTGKLELSKNQAIMMTEKVAMHFAMHMVDTARFKANITDKFVKSIGAFVGGFGVMNMVIILTTFYQAFSKDGSLLVSRLMKAIKARVETIPSSTSIMTHSNIFTWKDVDGHSMLEDLSGGQQNEGPHYMNFMDMWVAWPLPIESPFESGSASTCWEATIPDQKHGLVDLEDFSKQVNGAAAVMFRCYFTNGKPSGVWVVWVVNAGVVRVVNADLDLCKDFIMQTNGKETKWRMVKRCAFCIRGPPYADYHDHTQCLLVGMMNKVREQGGYSIIKVNGTVLDITLEKSQMDVEKWVKVLEMRISELEKRVMKLELKMVKKHTTDDPQDKSQKKAKPAPKSTAGPSSATKGKKKT